MAGLDRFPGPHHWSEQQYVDADPRRPVSGVNTGPGHPGGAGHGHQGGAGQSKKSLISDQSEEITGDKETDKYAGLGIGKIY